MSYKIPLFDLNFGVEEEEAVIATLRSKWISTGPMTIEFERMFSSMLGAKHALALSNCTVALHLAVKILGLGEGDEVICPSLTFVATINAIRYINATPVFCDVVSLENPTMDPNKVRALITSKTRAIVVMHYGGFATGMNEIMEIAGEHDLRVIEDACHGPMGEFEEKKLGTIGDIGCFSFFSNKNISTGEGGMLVTNNSDLFEQAKLLRSHGMTTMSFDRAKGHATTYDVTALGYNYRMDDIRASIGKVQLEKLPGDLIKRAENRRYYINNLSDIPSIIIPFLHYRDFSTNYIFPIILKDSNAAMRERIRSLLSDHGIQTSVHYPAVHRFKIYDSKCVLPLTEYISDNEISLPMFGNLSFDQIDYITEQLHLLF